MEQKNKVRDASIEFEGGEIKEDPKTPVKSKEVTSPMKGRESSAKKVVELTEEEKAEKEI